ncbi:hypothetical protein ACF0H5_021192 [Mactra antiquata]
MLYYYGFHYVWENPLSINFKSFINSFRLRAIDTFIQDWGSSKEQSGVLLLYNNCKIVFEYEQYLDILPFDLRYFVTRLRTSAHSLRIHTGRYSRNNIPRNERYCQICNLSDIEDEYHFVITCPAYSNIRKLYNKPYFLNRPSMLKFIELIQSRNKDILLNFALYCKKPICIRNNILNPPG